MIYLIDDKKERQFTYGWTISKFDLFKDVVFPIYTYSEMSDENFRQEIFSKDNVILIHESFFKNPINASVNKEFEVIRKDIYSYTEKNPNALIVFFSGSIASRKSDKNISYMPVSLFYQNLEFFLGHYRYNDSNIDYLFFGKNPEIETNLINMLRNSNNNIDSLLSSEIQTKNLYIRPSKDFIQKPLEFCEVKTIFNKVEDEDLITLINEWLTNEIFENIFIPLCFGPTLSDYIGLRFATLIRCTKTNNQLSNIFIYSFVGVEYFLNNECFNIIRTKNVQLIDYKRQAFKESVEKNLEPFTIQELPKEICKLKLDVPDNFEDNHSIANEWGIYQLAYNASIDIKEITDFNAVKLNSLYFKWLIAKNGLYEELPQKDKQENEIFRASYKKIELNTTIGFIDLNKIPKR